MTTGFTLLSVQVTFWGFQSYMHLVLVENIFVNMGRSSLHLEQRNNIRPLPISRFLTREGSRLIPRTFEYGNKASRLVYAKLHCSTFDEV